MRKIENIFEKMLPVVEKALDSYTDSNGNIPRTGRKPKFSDTKVIALCLSAEFLSLDSENRLFDLLRKSFVFHLYGLIDRSAFNRRRKLLCHYFNTVLDYLSDKIAPGEDVFIVDSLPIEVCRFARAKRAKICKDDINTAPDFGYCAAQRNTFFGYKLHALCGTSGVFRHIDLSKASIADIHYLQDVRENISHCILLEDKGYLSS